MTNEEAIAYYKEHNEILVIGAKDENVYDSEKQVIEADCMRITFEANEKAMKALEQQPIDKSAMMYEIYMEGVNMSGEYQGCWIRFKDIEKIVDKYMAEKESE